MGRYTLVTDPQQQLVFIQNSLIQMQTCLRPMLAYSLQLVQ